MLLLSQLINLLFVLRYFLVQLLNPSLCLLLQYFQFTNLHGMTCCRYENLLRSRTLQSYFRTLLLRLNLYFSNFYLLFFNNLFGFLLLRFNCLYFLNDLDVIWLSFRLISYFILLTDNLDETDWLRFNLRNCIRMLIFMMLLAGGRSTHIYRFS